MKINIFYVWICWLFLAFAMFFRQGTDYLKLLEIAGFTGVTIVLLLADHLANYKRKKDKTKL